jgi:glycine dehydrogenase subunit 2
VPPPRLSGWFPVEGCGRGTQPIHRVLPLIVDESMMVEPTETESKETLDTSPTPCSRPARAARESPEILREAPVTTPVRRLDEARAARQLKIRW